MPDATLTTSTPAGSTTRPVPPSWASVAPLLERWQMALLPQRDGSWDVNTGYAVGSRVPLYAVTVSFAALPQAIAELAARCEAEPAP